MGNVLEKVRSEGPYAAFVSFITAAATALSPDIALLNDSFGIFLSPSDDATMLSRSTTKHLHRALSSYHLLQQVEADKLVGWIGGSSII